MKMIVSNLYFDSILVLQAKYVVFFMPHVSGSYFFGAMKREIDKNVKGEISDILIANFTTTGPIESLLSAACMMHTFRHYFDYIRMRSICGIRQIHFMGECWIKNISKAHSHLPIFFLLSWQC
jgi:hypothetical protein